MTSEMLFDYMSVRLNGEKAENYQYTFNMIFPDINETYLLSVENGVLNYTKDKVAVDPDTTIIINRADLDSVILDVKKIPEQNDTSDEKNKAVQNLICSPAQTSSARGQKYVCTTIGDTSELEIGTNLDEPEYVDFSYGGDLGAFKEFLGLLDKFYFWFNIVLP